MPEPNATPAPLTMTREQEDEDRKSVFLTGHPRLLRALAELDATRAKLAEAEAQRDAAVRLSEAVDSVLGGDASARTRYALREANNAFRAARGRS